MSLNSLGGHTRCDNSFQVSWSHGQLFLAGAASVVTLSTGPGKSIDMTRIVIGRGPIWYYGGNMLGTLQC